MLDTVLNALTWTIKYFACLVGLLAWLIFGTVIALVMIARVVVAFSVTAMLQAFKAQDMVPIERSIQVALAFWPEGIERILPIVQKNAPLPRQEFLPWGRVLPSLVRDLGNLMFFCIPFAAYLVFTAYFGAKNASSGSLPSVNANVIDWATVVNGRTIQPGKGIGPLRLGSTKSQIYDLLGSPNVTQPDNSSNTAANGQWLYYYKDSGTLGVSISSDGTVQRILIQDYSPAADGALGRVGGLSLGADSAMLEKTLGTPISRLPLSNPPCDNSLSDVSATHWKFAGINALVCSNSKRVGMLEVTR